MGKTEITAKGQGPRAYLAELGQYRQLLVLFAWRDLKIKYAQTLLGLLLALVQPFVLLLVFTVLFERLIHLDTGTMPYPLFAFTGIVAWNLFSNVLVQSGGSLYGARDILQNVYFPRIILPLSKGLMGLAEALIQLVFLMVLMALYRYPIGWAVLAFPAYLLLNLMAALGLGIWLAAASLRFRDLMHAIPFVVGLGIWLTPVYYPVSLIPDEYKWLLGLNPLTGILEGYRWALLGGELDVFNQSCAIGMVTVLWFTGWWMFRRVDRKIVDFV
jgi:lipopolysaccharide transport system permease protein